jgi:hypothetical protein
MILAELAAKEQDSNKLLALVTEINELLAEKQPASNFALPPTGTSASGRRHLCERGGQE